MKRSAVVLALSLVFAAQSAYPAQVARANRKPAPPPEISSHAAAPRPVCEAYAVADAADGRVLEGRNLQLRWPMASVTKLMLAMVVAEKIEAGQLGLHEPVRVSRAAQGMGGTQVFLKAGETFTLNELMIAAMVESANDASYAVAEHVGGSVDQFVRLMNRKAAALGMHDTEFHGPHGLPPRRGGSDNLSTCLDLIRLARAALKHPQLLEWTSTERSTFRNGTMPISNHNRLLGVVPGVDGLKTGFTRRAGYNIVATGAGGERRLIVVVLGSRESRVRNAFAAEKFREYLHLMPGPAPDGGSPNNDFGG
jgi:serine-type D-Ala-D-Ala carboxypeptidase (penicillin-binding protein 5/6)